MTAKKTKSSTTLSSTKSISDELDSIPRPKQGVAVVRRLSPEQLEIVKAAQEWWSKTAPFARPSIAKMVEWFAGKGIAASKDGVQAMLDGRSIADG